MIPRSKASNQQRLSTGPHALKLIGGFVLSGTAHVALLEVPARRFLVRLIVEAWRDLDFSRPCVAASAKGGIFEKP